VVVEEEHAAAGCAQAVRGAIQVIIGVGLHEQGCAELSHRAAQLEEEQNKCEHRVAGCTGDSDRTLTESPGRTS
jgi:hypothetical protein